MIPPLVGGGQGFDSPLGPPFAFALLTSSELTRKSNVTTLPLTELELELIQTQMEQKVTLRAEVGMRVRCANKASAE